MFNTIALNTTSTAQMGNPTDSHGYEASVDITLLAKQDRFGDVYLIDTGVYYGIATKVNKDKLPAEKRNLTPDYRCTMAAAYSRFTKEEFASWLGFSKDLFAKARD